MGHLSCFSAPPRAFLPAPAFHLLTVLLYSTDGGLALNQVILMGWRQLCPCHCTQTLLRLIRLIFFQFLKIIIHATLGYNSPAPEEQAECNGRFDAFSENVVYGTGFGEMVPRIDLNWEGHDGNCKDNKQEEGAHVQNRFLFLILY